MWVVTLLVFLLTSDCPSGHAKTLNYKPRTERENHEDFSCGEDEAIYDGRCVNLHQPNICPYGERLYRVASHGRGRDEGVECNCEEGWIRHWDGKCYQEFSRGPCRSKSHILIPKIKTSGPTDPECRTERAEGGHSQPCVFPFKYRNTWYTGCTSVGLQGGKRWCATVQYPRELKATEAGGAKDWGLCSQGCTHIHEPGWILMPQQEELLKGVRTPKLECRPNPCGDPKVSRPHSSTWTGDPRNITCHPLAEDVSECEMEARDVGSSGVAQLVCYSQADIVSLSIISFGEKCPSRYVWSRWRSRCVRIYSSE